MRGFRRRAAVAVLAAAAVPVMLVAACDSGTSQPETSPTPRPGGNWIRLQQGRVVASPSTKAGALVADPSLLLPTLPSSRASSGSSTSVTCPPVPAVGNGINGLTVVPSRTSAVVTWYNQGGSDIVEYRLTAISQDLVAGEQAEVGWVTSTPVGCGETSATLTGLQPDTPYQFSVDVVRTRTGLDGVYAHTVARSGVISTTA
ncbi:fibronectin type III domain-containing protein [Actinoplanes sp. NBRC 101535]|uniref:fibronectin type III domain-containing protein n=1 Tax=Actinoplanes sp. NBRC 101535 TaxID=3032196 RepID=UPI002552FC78|nr:fibronectin type III domain-containing protein [Actinoplanes sp. NBRC 101535]